jgi:hypothetical protein
MPYLYGTEFILYTDHQPIKWLMTNDKLTGKLAHWALIIQEYEFKVIHTRRKTLIYNWCLQLFFSRKRHFITNYLIVA